MKSINLIFKNNIIFDIYLIGYKNQGESILFTLKDRDAVIYSCVIDSYEENNRNITIDKINELGIKKLDLICWTHPHDDHSIGMKKVLTEYANERTTIVYPNDLLKIKYNLANEVNECIKIIKDIGKSRKQKIPTLKEVSDMNMVDKRILIKGNKKYEFKIETLTPVTRITEKRYLNGKVDNLNDFSIAILVSIGGTKFLFAGDIENTSINKIDVFAITDLIDYIKIPHHSSNSSSHIFRIFDKVFNNVKGSISCTTEYVSGNLPNDDILNTYKNYYKRVYSTGKKNYRDFEYGIIHTSYDLTRNKFSNKLIGDSYTVYNENIKDTTYTSIL